MKKLPHVAVRFWLAPLFLAVLAAFGVWSNFFDSAEAQTPVGRFEKESGRDRSDTLSLHTESERSNVPYYRYRSMISEYNLDVSTTGSLPPTKPLSARGGTSTDLSLFRPVAGNVDKRFASGTVVKTPRYLVLRSLLI